MDRNFIAPLAKLGPKLPNISQGGDIAYLVATDEYHNQRISKIC